MTSRDIINAIAKKMIGTTYKDGYFIDVGNNIVCLTPTRVNMNTWNGYLKGDLSKELINISFLEGMNKEVPQVFLSENGTELFKVHEYCYIAPSIEDKDILPIIKSIAQIKDGIYQDTDTKKVNDSGIIPSFPPLELVLFNKDNNKVVSGIYRNVSAANNALRKMHNPNVEIRYRMLVNLKDEQGNRNEFYMPLDIILPYIIESKTNKNMKKNVVKINENTLRQIVAESVKNVLKEYHPDKVWRDTQAELFRKKQQEQDEIEISACMSELKPIFDRLEDKYGDLAYTAIMRLAVEMNPNPEY